MIMGRLERIERADGFTLVKCWLIASWKRSRKAGCEAPEMFQRSHGLYICAEAKSSSRRIPSNCKTIINHAVPHVIAKFNILSGQQIHLLER
jgi:hypothetical protein